MGYRDGHWHEPRHGDRSIRNRYRCGQCALGDVAGRIVGVGARQWAVRCTARMPLHRGSEPEHNDASSVGGTTSDPQK
jgi:hypothetical protein